MTEKQRRSLEVYVRWAANELELRDWTIVVSTEATGDDSHAIVTNTYGRKLATIRFEDGFRDLDPEQQRHTVAHELIHCHLESATNMALNDLDELVGAPAGRLFWAGYRRQIEYGVDALASAIAKHLPLIDWTKTTIEG